MKTYIIEPINSFFHAFRIVAIVGAIGAFTAAGFVVIGIEKIIKAVKP